MKKAQTATRMTRQDYNSAVNGGCGGVGGHALGRAFVNNQAPPTLTVIPPPKGEGQGGLDPTVGLTMKLPTRVEWDNDSTGVYVDDDEEALLMTSQDGVSGGYFRIAWRVPFRGFQSGERNGGIEKIFGPGLRRWGSGISYKGSIWLRRKLISE